MTRNSAGHAGGGAHPLPSTQTYVSQADMQCARSTAQAARALPYELHVNGQLQAQGYALTFANTGTQMEAHWDLSCSSQWYDFQLTVAGNAGRLRVPVPHLGRRTALNFPLFPPPQKN
ncbi:hypothetical protein [Paraburkholderia sp. SIMBA_030]|uniref:hypothetical protein n=1 Tax=Paraburkholderia sp. SIMBA_030 TaxID=3085773 RepID=UPI00397A3484